MGIRDKPTAPGSPWQNGAVERLIGSIRHPVGSGKQSVWHGQAERIRSLEINHRFELARSLGRQLAGIGTLEDAIEPNATLSQPGARDRLLHHSL